MHPTAIQEDVAAISDPCIRSGGIPPWRSEIRTRAFGAAILRKMDMIGVFLIYEKATALDCDCSQRTGDKAVAAGPVN